jgi:hypothetical protein
MYSGDELYDDSITSGPVDSDFEVSDEHPESEQTVYVTNKHGYMVARRATPEVA